jgi:ElaB/YqjD/DUF883 family membrane-anchored ribosome-binding protein
MKNRIAGHLKFPEHNVGASQAASPESRQSAHEKNSIRMGDAESYVRAHPLAAIGAAFCLGVLLAWMIKRK